MGVLGNKKNLTDKIFGKLKVIKEAGRNKHGSVLWECLCECGNITYTITSYLSSGDTKSCGCLGKNQLGDSRRKHGLSHKNNTEYEIWKGMKARCTNPNHANYDNYGGRGISVCDRWANSFDNFLKDMGLRPSKKHSLDRYPDANGNYELSNCRWATIDVQARNKRNNRWFSAGDKILILEDWAKEFNVHSSTLIEHLKTKDFATIYDFYSKKLIKN